MSWKTALLWDKTYHSKVPWVNLEVRRFRRGICALCAVEFWRSPMSSRKWPGARSQMPGGAEPQPARMDGKWCVSLYLSSLLFINVHYYSSVFIIVHVSDGDHQPNWCVYVCVYTHKFHYCSADCFLSVPTWKAIPVIFDFFSMGWNHRAGILFVAIVPFAIFNLRSDID